MMKSGFASLILLVLTIFAISVAGQSPATPQTPAGQTLRVWLDAFNSGDRARIQDYIVKYDPVRSLDNELNLRNQSGGYELISIDKNDRLSIEFIVREKKQRSNSLDGSLLSVFGKITVKDVAKDTDPAPVVAFALRIIPRGMTAADMNPKIDAATRAQVIEAAISKLDEYYVFPEIAKKMDESVQAKLNSGGYDDATASNDKHLRIDFSPQVLPKRDPNANQTPDPVAIARVRTQLESINCSFERVDWLPSNIGYLKLNGFNDPEICGPTVIAAMNFLAHTNALIIDLRENNGGSAKMLPYICSYFFTEPTHLSDVYYRK